MKLLKEILITFVITAGLSLSVAAQKDDQKKPPKEKPPVVNPGQKPPREKPRDNNSNKPKKPGSAFAFEVLYLRESDVA